MCAIGLVVLTSALAPAELPARFSYDFRKQPIRPAVLKFIGKDAKKHIHFRREGVLYSLPENQGKGLPPIGIGPRFKIKGDFEITVAFEVVRESEPAPGKSGLKMHIYIDTNTTRGATLQRSHLRGNGIQLVAHELTRDANKKGKHKFRFTPSPGKFTSGKLQLKRTGTKLAYLTSQGNSATFQEFHETDWSTEDVRLLRIGGTNKKAGAPFEFRILSLDIKCEELPTYLTPPPQPTSGATIVAIVAVAVLAVAGAVAVGFWIWRVRKAAE